MFGDEREKPPRKAWTRRGDMWERRLPVGVPGFPILLATVAQANAPGDKVIYVPQVWITTPSGEKKLLYDGVPFEALRSNIKAFDIMTEDAWRVAMVYRRLIHQGTIDKPHQLYGLGAVPLILNVCARVLRRGKGSYWIEVAHGRTKTLIVRDGPFANPSVATDHVIETLQKIAKGEGFGCVCR